MSFILYFVLRRFFVDLSFTSAGIVLRRGLFIRRIHTVPLRSVVRITVKRSVFLRIFRAKEAEICTLNGKFKLFLRRDEQIPFLPKPPARYIKPRFRETAFGAFIDVRALGAVALFAAVLRRIGTIFGGKYLDGILEVLDTAAVNVEQALSAMRVYVPRAAAALAVFALAAWTFAFLRKLAALSRFCVGRRGEYVTVSSGLFTLYEHTLVLNNAAAVMCDSPVSLIVKHSPLYLRDVMIFPSVRRSELRKVLRVLCGIRSLDPRKTVTPESAVFGFCAAPLGWSGGFAAAIALVYISDRLRKAMLLKTALYCGLFVSLYAAAVCLLYIKHSGIVFGERRVVCARRTLRLYTAVFDKEAAVGETISQSVFQRRSGSCNFKIYTIERRSFKVRLIPLDKCHTNPL